MPHPKNRLKLTGDTRLPDIGELLEQADEVEIDVVEVAPARVYADGWEPSEQQALPEEREVLPAPVMKAERAMERQVVATPWLAIGAALGFGFLVARMLRR